MPTPSEPAEPGTGYISTGHLPPVEHVQALTDAAYHLFGSNRDGGTSQVYPALARVDPDLFGICLVGASGRVYGVGRQRPRVHPHERLQAVRVCPRVPVPRARPSPRADRRQRTGLPFNSAEAVDRSADGRTNPMVNAGAIVTTSLAPGDELRGQVAVHPQRAGQVRRPELSLNEEVFASASETNFRNQAHRPPAAQLRPHLQRSSSRPRTCIPVSARSTSPPVTWQ